ncbi:MAG: DUF11 domain-containing protein [Ardenticatenaceae bacterium]|nr:DUF11 domain-containing protein [Ardenticatenaceae bacterium]
MPVHPNYTLRYFSKFRFGRGATYIVLLLLALPFLGHSLPTQAANPDGDLRLRIMTAPNFVVDSNVESPSTYAPEAATIGAQFCNDGTDTLTDVFGYIGDFDPNGDLDSSDSTPGIYPSRTHSGLTGTFQLVHEGGSAGTNDARRYVGDLDPGECKTQYWLLSYPRLDDDGHSVTGGIKPDDDLWLNYDVWATAVDNGTPLEANLTLKANMRNEISAAANKIWPNGDNKVPDVYKDSISELLGWDTITPSGGTDVYPGDTAILKGVWYDLGNVGAGFDNDGDLVPDKNAWVQPVGDPGNYDPGCFRLVRTYGIVIVKLKGGGEYLIPFVDQLYFQNIPENTGAVGLVFYEYAALDGTCQASLTPYQEVASGFDNEKFNGDYGHHVPPLSSLDPTVTLDKTVDQALIGPALPDTLTYTLTISNTGPVAVGDPDIGLPLVIEEAIPAGTSYVAGTAVSNNTLPTGVSSYTILYSTDHGNTWSQTEPPAATVTNIQWWLSNVLASGAGGDVTFQVTVPTTYTGAIVPNEAQLSFGYAPPFAEDTAVTRIRGINELGDTVFTDDGNGEGNQGNGVQDGNEAGIPGITVNLYYDEDGDGVGEYFLESAVTDSNGNYLFTELADGRYVVEVDPADAALPTGYAPTTKTSLPVSLDVTNSDSNPVSYLDADFGFSPALILEKTLTSPPPAYEGQEVTYSIDVTNAMPDGSFQPEYWATAAIAGTEYEATVADNANNVIGEPDGVVNSQIQNWPEGLVYAGMVKGTGFQVDACGSITQVEALYQIEITAPLDDDFVWGIIQLNGTDWYTFQLTPAESNAFAVAGGGLLAVDITSSNMGHAGSVTDWATFDNVPSNELQLGIGGDKETNADGEWLLVDAIGVRITNDGSSCTNFTSDTILNPVPLSDSYDPTQLSFIAADVVPTAVNSGSGIITWNNVGPLAPGETKTINLTFEALEPAGNLVETLTNTAVINNATFINGQPANDATDDAVTTLNPTGSIAGTIWSEGSGGSTTGWNGVTGWEAGLDLKVPEVTVYLYGCTDGFGTLLNPDTVSNRACTSVQNDGTWELLATTTTDANGDYLFDGLRNGYYTVEVETSTLPGTVAQTAEAGSSDANQNGGGRTCGTCNSYWGDITANLSPANFNPINTVGEDIINVNFGYTVPPAIYGVLWEDNDGDGIRDAGEDPLGAGITVTLTDDLSNTLTTTTLADGSYQFVNLVPGRTYTVTVNTGTLPGTGWSNTADPDGTPNSQYIVGTLTAGQVSGSHDFGYHQTGTAVIGDTVYYDWDGDGTQDSGEEGIAGVTLSLYEDSNNDGELDLTTDALIATDVTDADGNYSFNNLPAGSYVVVSEMPADTVATGDPDESGQCTLCDLAGASTNLTAGSTDDTVDFGFLPLGTGSIGDTVWLDVNGDGVQSGVQELGLGGITVQLFVDLNGDTTFDVVLTTSTDANGNYLFENLPDGNYEVTIDLTDPDIPTDGLNNDYVLTTNSTFATTLSGNSYLLADFGFAPLGAIGDTIYWDANGDGEYDWNESGIPGVVITLTNATAQTLIIDGVSYAPGAVITTTTTDGNGRYLFDALPPADYGVTVGPIGGSPTLTGDPEADGVPCTDPGATGCDGTTTVTIGYGTNYMGADFGYQAPGAFGDYVWFDQNGDGVQDSGEIGLAGVVITATTTADVTVGGVNYPAGTTITTTTDYDGYYSFDNLISNGSAATWTVTSAIPASMSPTYDADGTPNASTTVTIDPSGDVTAVGGTPCTNCSLTVDFGFEMDGPYSLNGSVCLEGDTASNRVCGDGTDVPVGGYQVYLYNDDGLYLGTTYTDASGFYSFSNLVDDTYFVVIGGSLPPLDTAEFVTTPADTPATNIIDTGTSIYQIVPVNSATAAGDGGSDSNIVEAVDFAYLSTVDFDFGDLPQSYNTTLEGNPSGPRHEVPTTPTLYLGTAPDSELNGVPDVAASSDGSDEDGVTPVDIQSWTDGTDGGSVSVEVVGSGWLVGWIDFNGDGDLTDSGELIIDQAVSTNTYTFAFDIPAGTMSGSPTNFYGRFRLFSEQPPFSAFAYSGPASAGEVEDYNWLLSENPVIGIAKRLVSVSGNGDGSYTVTYGLNVENLGDVALQNVQVTDNLATTFAAADSYAVSSVTSDLFTVNYPGYDGSSNINLLTGSDSLALNTTAQITLTVVMTPGLALGPYNNSATANGESPSGTPTTDISDDGTDPDPDGGSDPNETGENDPTPLLFAAVTGHVFIDLDGNGAQNGAESDLPNVDVIITDLNGDTQTVTTDANGDYTAVVPAGNTAANIDETTLPAGYTQTAGTDPSSVTAVAGNTADIGEDGYQPSSSLTVEKLLTANGDEDNSSSISVGDTLTYTITATNNGSSILNNVTVSDDLTGQSTSCLTVAPSATCVLIATYTVTQADVDAGYVENTATADSDETDPVDDTHNEPVPQNPALVLDKALFGYADEDSSGTITLNDVLTYTFTTTNTGNVTLTGVTIVDPLPGLSALSCDQSQPATLTVGGTLTCTATYTVTQADVDAGTVNNTATADSDQTSPDTDSETVPVPQNPALVLDKVLFGYSDEDASGTLTLNDVLTYTFTTTNTGNVTLTGVTIVDPLPGLSALSCNQSQPATLAVGGTLNCSATYTVTQADVDAGAVNNTATADSDQTGPDTDSETVPVPQNPALALDKALFGYADEDGSGTITLNDVLTYTFTTTNTGNVTLTGVTIVDSLPGLSSLSCDQTQPVTLAVGGTLTCSATYTVTQTDVDAGAVDNTATADSTETDPVDDSETVPVAQNPALILDKALFGYADEDASGTITLNDVLTYTFTTTNTGNVTLTGVTIVDPLPGLSALTCDQPQPATLAVGGTLTCSAAYIVMQADVDAGAVNNTATADSDQTGPDTDSETVPVSQNPALVLDKALFGYADEDVSGTITLNDVLTYTFTTTNTGNVTLTGVTIVDPLPGLSVLSCDQSQPATLAVGGTLTCSATYTITQANVDTGAVNNTATTDSDQTGPETDSETVPVSQNPALVLDKALFGYADEDGSGTVTLNDVLTYTFTTTNTGNVTLTGVTIVDPLPGLSGLSCDHSQPATLAVGGTLTCSATYTVTQTDVDAGVVNNTATADSDQTGPETDSETVPVTQGPALVLDKALFGYADEDGSGTITLNDVLTYTFTTTNTGNVTLTGVTIVDPLPGLSALSCDQVQPATLTVGDTLTCTATYTVTQADVDAGVVNNTATADSIETDPVDDSETVPVPQNPALVLDKALFGYADEDSSGTVTLNDVLTYTFTTTNTGNVTLNGVTIVDPLPGLSVLSCDQTQPATLAVGGTLTCTATYIVMQADVDAGAVNNTATADSDQTGPDTDSETVSVPQNPALVLDKALFGYADEDGSGTVTLNDVLTYTFTTTNTGNVTLTGVTIVDPLPGLSALSCDQPQPATLAVGGTLTCSATYIVTQTDVDAGVVNNTATADSDQTGPETDSETVPVLQNASVGDFVWLDLNGNGLQDGGEPGLANVTVNLYTSGGSFVSATSTDSSGAYAFTNLVPGSYYVEFVLPSGYAFTYANQGADTVDSDANVTTGQTAVFTLTAGENETTWDAGLFQIMRLGNRIWFDINNNGVLDSGEQGVPNVLVELLDGSANLVLSPLDGQPLTAVTDATGRYLFESIPPGEYIVRVAASNFMSWTAPLYGFVSSQNEVSPDPALDPDGNNSDVDDNGRNNPDPANGGIVSYPVTLTVGGEPTNEGSDEDGIYPNANSNLTVDFGFFELLTLGNTIWHDANENSILDSGETGFAGVVVYLLDANGNPVLGPTGQPLRTVTNNNGQYQFTNLYPGEYRVLVGAENFQPGGVLEGFWSSPGAVDPDNNSDIDDNGVDEVEPWNTGIVSQPLRLDYDQEPDNNDDTDDNDNTNLTVDMGFVGTPTAVTLTSFSATNLGNQQVRINWTTESEVDNFGFRIYRSSSNSFGSATEVHFEPTAVPGGSGPGASYTYVDDVPDNGTYYYWLVDVETGGATEVHGPITVTVTPFITLYLPLIISGN